MKVYVVEMWSDIHNWGGGPEINEPVVFRKKKDADEYAEALFDEVYPVYEDDLKNIDDWHWLTKPKEEDGSWSFNTDREDRIECSVYEKEVR